MRKLYILGLIALAATIIGLAWAEQMTFSTYYPAPFGVYNQMATRTLGVGDNSGDGNITSADVPDPTTDPNELWVAGNVGIGTTSPGAKLHVGGTAGTDGIMFPDGTLQTTAGGGAFGDWVDMGSSQAAHGPVATGGFVVVRSWALHGDNRIYSDANPNPTTARFMSRSPHGGQYYGAMIPVKKGHYWRVYQGVGSGGTGGSLKIYWIPFGS